MEKEELLLIKNAFAQFASMHDLSRTQLNFPQHLLDEMTDYLSKTIPFSIDNFSYVLESQQYELEIYKTPFLEQVLRAHTRLKDLAFYYANGANGHHYKPHLDWFIQYVIDLPVKERKALYDTILFETPRDKIIEDYQKNQPTINPQDLATFAGMTILKPQAEKKGIKCNFMTYFLVFAKDKLDNFTDDSQREATKKMAQKIIDDYQKINKLSFQEFKDKYALSALYFSKNSSRFNALVQFFHVDFATEKQYVPSLLSHLNGVHVQGRNSDLFIQSYLKYNFSYDDCCHKGICVKNYLYRHLQHIMVQSIDVRQNEYKAEILEQRLDSLFKKLDQYKQKGLDLEELLNFRMNLKDGSKSLTLSELFEQQVKNTIEQNKYHTQPEIEKILFEATSYLRLSVKEQTLSDGKKLKI